MRWEQPGYEIAFTTRSGGVSDGVYASLNLGALTSDLAEHVDENRRRACAEVGADPVRLTLNRQVHSAAVHEATAGRRGEDEGDGLWTAETGLPLLVLSADCVPIALVSTEGAQRLALLHAGWRGLLAGVVETGVRALGRGPLAAAVGPSIGPCCYEVGEEVAEPFREAFGDDVAREGRLDLWTSTERALRAAGCQRVERFDLCTSCDPDRFFSHRRDRGRTGRQGVIAAVTG
jgi:polyphenol oxidase